MESQEHMITAAISPGDIDIVHAVEWRDKSIALACVYGEILNKNLFNVK